MKKAFLVKEKFISNNTFSEFAEKVDRIKAISLDLKDLGAEINYRQLVYWYNEGLLLADPKKDKLKSLDFMDYCWIHVVNVMRSFGMSVKSILEIKSVLMSSDGWLADVQDSHVMNKIMEVIPIDQRAGFAEYIKQIKTSNDRFDKDLTIFFILIIDFVVSREQLSLLINKDNQVVIYKDSEYDTYIAHAEFQDFFKGSYLKISLSEIIWKFLRADGFEMKDEQLEILSEPEQKILQAIREGNVKEITVRFQDNEPKLLSVTHTNKVDASLRLLELIKAGRYQDIKITTQDGKIASFENTIKHKL